MRAAAILLVPGGVPPEYAAVRAPLLERTRSVAAPFAAELRESTGSAEEIEAAFDRAGGPVVVLAADVPRLREQHVQAALDDLAAGAAASLGPTFDGGWYIVALARPGLRIPPPLEPAATVLAAAGEQGIEAGLLRMERALRSEQDARALRVDPLLAEELRIHLVTRSDRTETPTPPVEF